MKLVSRGTRRWWTPTCLPSCAGTWTGLRRSCAACTSCSCSRTAGSPMRGALPERTAFCRGPQAEWSARCALRSPRASTRSSGFDMGGTSTDVSHFAGAQLSDLERVFETQVAGVRMRAPMMSIHTVAAGRRLDPAFRRLAVSRRPGLGRRQSGSGKLPRRRAAHGDRLQRHARKNPAEILSPGVRPPWRCTARRRHRACEIHGSCRRDPGRYGRHPRARAGRGGLH